MGTHDVQKLGVATAALIVAEASLAHFGVPGVLAGLAASWAAYEYSDPLVAKWAEKKPSQPTTKDPGKPSFGYRLLNGKSARGQRWDEDRDVTADDFDAAHLGNEAFIFSELLATGWRPTFEQIFLARLEDGTDVFITVEQAVHIALAGSTRQGKTSIIRQLLLQLCSIGCCCILLDPHYTPYDVETDEDWTPFTPHLRFDPLECKDFDRMEKILRHAATVVLDSRKKLRGDSKPVGVPIFIIIDEYPAVLAEKPKIQEYVATLLRQGAKYKIFLCVASQDFQVKTVSPQSGGGIRDCYKTVLYVGGDKTTANVLLDGPVDPSIETMLGKGPVMLRCETVKKAALAQTAFTDNQSLYLLLGPSTYQPIQDDDELADGYNERDFGDELDDGEKHEPQTETLPEVAKRDQRRKAEEIDIKIAIALWNGGFNSRAKLAKALDIAENQAGKLMALMNVHQPDGRTDG
jgi:hypothetical protein